MRTVFWRDTLFKLVPMSCIFVTGIWPNFINLQYDGCRWKSRPYLPFFERELLMFFIVFVGGCFASAYVFCVMTCFPYLTVFIFSARYIECVDLFCLLLVFRSYHMFGFCRIWIPECWRIVVPVSLRCNCIIFCSVHYVCWFFKCLFTILTRSVGFLCPWSLFYEGYRRWIKAKLFFCMWYFQS